jgi:hypothetical protein
MTWTREAIIEAIQAEYERTGLPPSCDEWRRGTDDHPPAIRVQRTFGSWRAGIEAAGLKPRTSGGLYWTKRRIIAAIKRWAERHDRPPTWDEWVKAGPYNPPARIVRHAFGSWNRALWEAGFFPRSSHGAVVRREPIPAHGGRDY